MKNTHAYKYRHKEGFGALAIIIAVAVVLVVGGGGYYAIKSNNEVKVEENTEEEVVRNETTLNSKTSIKGLLSLGRDMACTFERTDASGTSEGTIFISGDTMRGDFTTTSSSGESVDSHMIRAGDKMYIWSSAQGNQGIVMSGNFDSAATAQTKGQSYINVDENLDYKCSNWSPDSSKFTPPSDITFMDISTMLKTNTNITVPLP